MLPAVAGAQRRYRLLRSMIEDGPEIWPIEAVLAGVGRLEQVRSRRPLALRLKARIVSRYGLQAFSRALLVATGDSQADDEWTSDNAK